MTMNKSMKCKKILCNSETTKKDFLKYYPKYPEENVKVTYLGVDLEEKEVNIDKVLPKDYKERGYFIYMGGTPGVNKNSDGVIKGYREFLTKVKHDRKAPYLVIAGKNFTKEVDRRVVKFKDKVECLGLKEYVVYTGFYEDKHSKPLLQNSISFIHLSLYEGFGIALVEAMKAGAPVIAHNGSCYPEVLQNAGILVDGLNPKDVGEAMYNVYTDKNLRDELIQNGLERSKSFSWEDTVEETLKVFNSIS